MCRRVPPPPPPPFLLGWGKQLGGRFGGTTEGSSGTCGDIIRAAWRHGERGCGRWYGMQGRMGPCGGVLLPSCRSFIISCFLCWHHSLPESHGHFAVCGDSGGSRGFVLGICSGWMGRGKCC